jgi:hypothetical protein
MGKNRSGLVPKICTVSWPSLCSPLIDAGWKLQNRTGDLDDDLGANVVVTLVRGKDLIDVELFDAGWLQVFSYSNSYQPDPDEPMLPMFTLENPSDLSNECWDRGLLK